MPKWLQKKWVLYNTSSQVTWDTVLFLKWRSKHLPWILRKGLLKENCNAEFTLNTSCSLNLCPLPLLWCELNSQHYPWFIVRGWLLSCQLAYIKSHWCMMISDYWLVMSSSIGKKKCSLWLLVSESVMWFKFLLFLGFFSYIYGARDLTWE